MNEILKQLPSVDQVLGLESTKLLLERYRREYVADLIRQVLREARAAALESPAETGREALLRQAEAELTRRVESG